LPLYHNSGPKSLSKYRATRKTTRLACHAQLVSFLPFPISPPIMNSSKLLLTALLGFGLSGAAFAQTTVPGSPGTVGVPGSPATGVTPNTPGVTPGTSTTGVPGQPGTPVTPTGSVLTPGTVPAGTAPGTIYAPGTPPPAGTLRGTTPVGTTPGVAPSQPMRRGTRTTTPNATTAPVRP
jgi:hypothetical protein